MRIDEHGSSAAGYFMWVVKTIIAKSPQIEAEPGRSRALICPGTPLSAQISPGIRRLFAGKLAGLRGCRASPGKWARGGELYWKIPGLT